MTTKHVSVGGEKVWPRTRSEKCVTLHGCTERAEAFTQATSSLDLGPRLELHYTTPHLQHSTLHYTLHSTLHTLYALWVIEHRPSFMVHLISKVGSHLDVEDAQRSPSTQTLASSVTARDGSATA